MARQRRPVDTRTDRPIRKEERQSLGIVSRFERRLRNTVDDAFARVFGGSVMPKEVETALEAGGRRPCP